MRGCLREVVCEISQFREDSGSDPRDARRYNKRDSALVQFECPEHAENARAVLTNCPLWGRNVSVSTSKHLTVQANRSDLEDESSKLFGDYTNSPLHRYGYGAAARNVPSIEPSRLLHISNIPLIMEESSLRALFEDHFGPVSKFKFITNSNREGQPSERKMALIELPTVQVPRAPPRAPAGCARCTILSDLQPPGTLRELPPSRACRPSPRRRARGRTRQRRSARCTARSRRRGCASACPSPPPTSHEDARTPPGPDRACIEPPAGVLAAACLRSVPAAEPGSIGPPTL
jgi:hypothetical protein